MLLSDLTQCESCEGYFDPEKHEMSSDTDSNYFCPQCWEGIVAEIRKSGIDNLDEYLKSRNLIKDFNTFASAKYHCVTEKEIKEMG